MKSIRSIIDKLSLETPEAPAVMRVNKSVSRYVSAHRTNQLVDAYNDIGVGQGGPVAIALPNPIAFYQVCKALWKTSTTPQSVTSKHPKAEFQAIIELAQPILLDHLVARLVRYKISRTIDFVNKPVRCDTGKVRRSELNSGAAV